MNFNEFHCFHIPRLTPDQHLMISLAKPDLPERTWNEFEWIPLLSLLQADPEQAPHAFTGETLPSGAKTQWIVMNSIVFTSPGWPRTSTWWFHWRNLTFRSENEMNFNEFTSPGWPRTSTWWFHLRNLISQSKNAMNLNEFTSPGRLRTSTWWFHLRNFALPERKCNEFKWTPLLSHLQAGSELAPDDFTGKTWSSGAKM